VKRSTRHSSANHFTVKSHYAVKNRGGRRRYAVKNRGGRRRYAVKNRGGRRRYAVRSRSSAVTSPSSRGKGHAALIGGTCTNSTR
jgi:hypothetical protein